MSPAAPTPARLHARYTADELTTVEKRRAAGASWDQIAAELDRPTTGVRQKAKNERITRARACRLAARRERVRAMHANGLTPARIAEKVNAHPDTVRADLSALGLTPNPPADPCCEPSGPTCATCHVPVRERVAELHADGRTAPAIGRALGLTAYTVRGHLRALGLTPNRPAVTGQKRPDNRSARRLAQIATGAMIQRIDDSLGLIQGAILEELAGFFPGLEDETLGAMARTLGIRLTQAAQSVWFAEEFADGDPVKYLADRRAVLLKRAELERKAGRMEESRHWVAVAASCDVRAGLVPKNGTLQRVSADGFAALAKRLKGEPAAGGDAG